MAEPPAGKCRKNGKGVAARKEDKCLEYGCSWPGIRAITDRSGKCEKVIGVFTLGRLLFSSVQVRSNSEQQCVLCREPKANDNRIIGV